MLEHRSRFKAYLIAPENLPGEALQLKDYLIELRSLYLKQQISSAEYATFFIFLYLNARSNDWWMKKTNPWQGLLENKGLSHWLSEFQFKKLPDSIVRSLYFWLQGEYKIILKFQPVSPLEMLEHQARGERVVTLSHTSAVQGALVDGARDAFEFLLHDLVHANLFFSDAQKHSEQKDFFSRILKLIEQGALVEEQKIDRQFQTDFHYLISDMNSHPAHLSAMLKASYIKHLLFKENKSPQDILSSESQGHLALRLKEWQNMGLNLN